MLTFNLANLFLFATHCLVMIIICAKSFLNPTMHTKFWVGHGHVSLKLMHKV